MYFLFSTFLMLALNAQNLHPSWPTARHPRTARSGNSSDQKITRESWMDGLSDYEIMVYQNFALSSKIYPDKLNLLQKEGLRSNRRRPSFKNGDIDYGDRYWRRNVLVTNITY